MLPFLLSATANEVFISQNAEVGSLTVFKLFTASIEQPC